MFRLVKYIIRHPLIIIFNIQNERLRWSRGERAGLWYPSSRVQKRRIFRAKKSSARLPSEGKQSRRSHVVNLRHLKEPKSDVEVATFGKILGNFSPIVPHSAAGVRSRRFRHEGHLVAEVGTF